MDLGPPAFALWRVAREASLARHAVHGDADTISCLTHPLKHPGHRPPCHGCTSRSRDAYRAVTRDTSRLQPDGQRNGRVGGAFPANQLDEMEKQRKPTSDGPSPGIGGWVMRLLAGVAAHLIA